MDVRRLERSVTLPGVRARADVPRTARDVESPAARGAFPFTLAAFGLVALALALRLYRIDAESLWHDEAYTLLMSRFPFERVVTFSGTHEHPPVYYLLVHTIFAVHDSYIVPRVLSAIAGSLSVLAIYLLGSRLFSPIAGLVAAALLAIAPFHLWHSQNARAHELAGLLVLLSYLCLFSAFENRQRRMWLAYVVSTILALYTDYVAVPVLLPQALLLIRARQAGLVRPLVAAWTAVIVAFAPWVAAFAFHNAVEVTDKFWIPSPTFNAFAHTVLEFLGMQSPCPTATPCVPHRAPVLGGLGGPITVISVAVLLAFTFHEVRRRRLTTSVLAVWLILPFAMVFVIALVRSLYLDRYFLLATFGLYLLLGYGVAKTWGQPRKLFAVVGAVVVIVLAGAYDDGALHAQPSNPDWKPVVRTFRAEYRSGEAVAFYPGVLQTLTGAYLPARWHASREAAIWLSTYLDVPGWQHRYAGLTDHQLISVQLTMLTSGYHRLWLIADHYTGLPYVRRWLGTHGFRLVRKQWYPGNLYLELWGRSRL